MAGELLEGREANSEPEGLEMVELGCRRPCISYISVALTNTVTESNSRKQGFVLTGFQRTESIVVGNHSNSHGAWREAGAGWPHFHLQTGNNRK